MHLVYLHGWLLLPIIAVVADTNEFIFPSKMDFDHTHINGSYEIGSLMTLRWKTEWNAVTIILCQDGPLPFQYLPNSQALAKTTSFIWPVDISGVGGNPKFDLSKGSLFFFGIVHTGTVDLFESQYFNITPKAAKFASSRATSTTPTPTPTSSSHTSSTILATTSPPPSPTSASIPNPSTAPPPPLVTALAEAKSVKSATAQSSGDKWKTGIAVAAAVLALLSVFGIGLYLWRRRSSVARGNAAVQASPVPKVNRSPLLPMTYMEMNNTHVVEIPAKRRTQPIYEM